MRYFLSPRCREVLTRLAAERTLCAFDFDGTLSPIVEHPGRAAMPARTRQLLVRLAALYPCVIVSGRGRKDLVGRLGGVKVARAIGNHGAERDSTPKTPSPHVQAWKAILARELSSLKGIWVEDKGLSLAVHYRRAMDKGEARKRILAVTRGLKRVRVIGGKQVLNLMMDSAPNKGVAVAAERDRMRCNWVLYVGDDDNDEDAFAVSGNIVAVRIGRKPASHARYYLRNQTEIAKLLEQLILLRQPVEHNR